MFVERKLAALFSIFVAGWLTLHASAIEVTELAGAAHGYPGLCEAQPKKNCGWRVQAVGRRSSSLRGHHLQIATRTVF
jgi:hypothetical protein